MRRENTETDEVNIKEGAESTGLKTSYELFYKVARNNFPRGKFFRLGAFKYYLHSNVFLSPQLCQTSGIVSGRIFSFDFKSTFCITKHTW